MNIAILFMLSLATAGCSQANAQSQKIGKTKVAVWDTYITRKDGSIMHFDIIAPAAMKDTNVIYSYGREYLQTKGQGGQPLTSKQCRFCHIRDIWPQCEAEINSRGYFILEMEGCK